MNRKIILNVIFVIILFIGCSQEGNKEAESKQSQSVSIYLVALEGSQLNGKVIGCNDILVEEKRNVEQGNLLIETAISELINAKNSGELNNHVKGPGLKLIQVTVAGGIADVYLKGDFAIWGECDIPRIKEQLLATVNQFTEYKKINIYVNDKTLENYLSLVKDSF